MSESSFRVLYLRTHNSARSQMVEGLARALGGGRIDAFRIARDDLRRRIESELMPDATRSPPLN